MTTAVAKSKARMASTYTLPLLRISMAVIEETLNRTRIIETNRLGLIIMINTVLMTENLPPNLQKNPSSEMIVENEEDQQRAQTPVDDGLVMASRPTHRINSDRMEKLWEELNKKQTVQQLKIEKRQALQRHISEVDKKKHQFGNVSERSQQRISRCMAHYKLSNNNRFYIDVPEKVRSDFKQKVVQCLLYAIQELREVHKNPNQRQVKIIDMGEQEATELVRGIAIETELCLVKYFNKSLRGKIQRNYRERANTIFINLKDEVNLQLRRKVISGQFNPLKLATAEEIELFTQARRDQINAKTRQQMAQTIMDMPEEVAEPEVIQYTDVKDPEVKMERTVSQKQKAMDERIYQEIQQLIGKQIEGFKHQIVDDLPGRQASFLIQSLQQVFK